ncbi:MAG: hypothetical protein F4Y60_13235 [Boseongicola sp. SB0664_bin_43]|uniref:CN hydrolase domain-containing protein n=1 Tax=Boseongicola sp. SB0664_bin_43 TaxID=2604844 RepID=A0A6B0Y2S6_9RHOB|nr:hypothetical protein [Boseongicola sp. SB0664_bin_43]
MMSSSMCLPSRSGDRRHACALTTLEATSGVRRVSLWLGHRSLQTTKTYLRKDPAEMLGAIQEASLPDFGVLTCREIIASTGITGPARPPRWLLNITDDAWFGVSSGPCQHFQAARLRAVEQGLPVVRVANKGISGILDATLPAPLRTPHTMVPLRQLDTAGHPAARRGLRRRRPDAALTTDPTAQQGKRGHRRLTDGGSRASSRPERATGVLRS